MTRGRGTIACSRRSADHAIIAPLGDRMKRSHVGIGIIGVGLLCAGPGLGGQSNVVTATLTYGAPGNGPSVNFSPKGTQVPLVDVPGSMSLPEGAVAPRKSARSSSGPAASPG